MRPTVRRNGSAPAGGSLARRSVRGRCVPVLIEHPLGDGLQVGDGDYSQACAKGKALGHGGTHPHASEGTGTATKSDGVEIGEGDAGFGEQLIDHGQNALGVAALHLDFAGREGCINQQGGGAIFRRGVQGEELGHLGSCLLEWESGGVFADEA